MIKMKTKIVTMSFTVVLLCITSLAQTQAEMNQGSCSKYKDADAEMNKMYKRILNEYKSKPIFIKKLKAAQRAWLRFRDAHLDSLYPAQNATEYGSVYPMCRCMVLEELTNQRKEQLLKWITGVEEGDVCSGSIKIR